MSDFNFKVGDRVYYPSALNRVLTLSASLDGGSKYPLQAEWVASDGECVQFPIAASGKKYPNDFNHSIFPATQQWYDKLIHAYPDLESPPKYKESRKVIEAMLEDGWDCVVCTVGDCENMLVHVDLISSIDESSDMPFLGYNIWRYACPFDPKTGKSIADYANGEVILEG